MSKWFSVRWLGCAALLLAALPVVPLLAGEVMVFAAASLTDAMGEVAQDWQRQSGNQVVLSFASSSTLARQIAHGAEADLFVSANLRWMDYLQDNQQIRVDSRRNLLANRLVLVAPAGGEIDKVDIHQGFELAALLGDGYLAMGNPAHVPAGIYGKQALTALGAWGLVKDHVARAANVRAALALVATGEAPLGIVYKTDALLADKVAIVGTFPADSHEPVIYPLAMTTGSGGNMAAQAFFDYLQSPAAAEVFARYGFTPPAR